jgi:hypothetical protein
MIFNACIENNNPEKKKIKLNVNGKNIFQPIYIN